MNGEITQNPNSGEARHATRQGSRLLCLIQLCNECDRNVGVGHPFKQWPLLSHPYFTGFLSKLGVDKEGGFITLATAWPPLFLSVGHRLATPCPPLAFVFMTSFTPHLFIYSHF